MNATKLDSVSDVVNKPIHRRGWWGWVGWELVAQYCRPLAAVFVNRLTAFIGVPRRVLLLQRRFPSNRFLQGEQPDNGQAATFLSRQSEIDQRAQLYRSLCGSSYDVNDTAAQFSNSHLAFPFNPAELSRSASQQVNRQCSGIYKCIKQGGEHALLVLYFEGGLALLARLRPPNPKDMARPAIQTEGPTEGQPNRSRRTRILSSEIATLRFVAQRISVSVPEVFGHDFDEENKIGAAYMLLEILRGKTLAEAWPTLSLSDKIVNFIPSLTMVLAKFAQMRQRSIGSIYEMGDNMYYVGPFALHESHSEVIGPFSTPRQYLRALAGGAMLQIRRSDEESTKQRAAVMNLVEHATLQGLDDQESMLVHPDWDAVNILVDDHGTIIGLLDFTGAKLLPIGLGVWGLPSQIPTEEHTNQVCKELQNALRNLAPELAPPTDDAVRMCYLHTICDLGRRMDNNEFETFTRMHPLTYESDQTTMVPRTDT
ncbi:hypothetical protein CALCODRAFT_505048 [Calocera cornea HHB12733]|uniref:Aminoglycoside phosphotransferase domain-containing protein n=1 Tax=Calocera cornea HHB12733 TaxID=1353952 RepID=A0A165C1L9_9BASI|nr:hypothetical protein CALCODRAFT_505048 [Calocera cornea HHB12733]